MSINEKESLKTIDKLSMGGLPETDSQHEESIGILAKEIIMIAIPIVFTFIGLSLVATFMFYLLSDSPLYMTEGYSLTLLYFNCIVVGIFWGGTFGYQILGSNANGKGNYDRLNEYHYQSLVITIVAAIIVGSFSVFVAPTLLSLLHPDPLALSTFLSLMKTFSFAILLFAIYQAYMRLANILQDTQVCLYSAFSGCVINALISFLCIRWLDMGIHSIGLGYCANFLFSFVFFYFYYSQHENSNGKIKPFSFKYIHWKGMLKQLKYGAFPMINYLMFLVSIETASFFGFMVSDVTFTVLTCLMNILSVIVVISEAVSCAMSALLSFKIGEKKFQVGITILKAAFIISVLVQFFLLGSLLMFSDTVLQIFSKDEEFLNVASGSIKLFTVAISLNSFHFLLCEYIIVHGNHSLPFYSLLIGKYIIQISTAFLLTPIYHLDGIIISMIIGQAACICIFLVYIRNNLMDIGHESNSFVIDEIKTSSDMNNDLHAPLLS